MTSIVVHLIACIIAVVSLRSHKIGRWYAVLIILAGIITPIVPSALTSKICPSKSILHCIIFCRCTSISNILRCIGGNKTILLFRTWCWTNWCYTFLLFSKNFVYAMIIIIISRQFNFHLMIVGIAERCMCLSLNKSEV